MGNLGWCSWLQEPRERFFELVKSCPLSMNGLSTKEYLKIFPLGSYDFLIGMDWLDQNNAILDCHKKEFTFLDEEGNQRAFHGIPRAFIVR
jgi:hypothetical protein